MSWRRFATTAFPLKYGDVSTLAFLCFGSNSESRKELKAVSSFGPQYLIPIKMRYNPYLVKVEKYLG